MRFIPIKLIDQRLNYLKYIVITTSAFLYYLKFFFLKPQVLNLNWNVKCTSYQINNTV